jgi:hypothetical protein
MRFTTKIKLKMEVEVELECEFSPIFREASIISANIPEAQVSSRKVYASMVSGNYNDLDSRVQKEIKDKFLKDTWDFHGAQDSGFPEEGVRSVPCEQAEWLRIMKKFRNCGLPLMLINQAMTSLGVMIEPVLCRTPTAYLWPRDSSTALDTEAVNTHMRVTKAVNIENQTDGSIKLTWRRNG